MKLQKPSRVVTDEIHYAAGAISLSQAGDIRLQRRHCQVAGCGGDRDSTCKLCCQCEFLSSFDAISIDIIEVPDQASTKLSRRTFFGKSVRTLRFRASGT
jgi:hypothetical protein